MLKKFTITVGGVMQWWPVSRTSARASSFKFGRPGGFFLNWVIVFLFLADEFDMMDS